MHRRSRTAERGQPVPQPAIGGQSDPAQGAEPVGLHWSWEFPATR